MLKTTKKILLTGGHLSPALSVLEELKRQDYEIVFVGRRSALSDQSDLSLEYRLLSENPKIKFISLSTGRLTKGSWTSLPTELFKSGSGILQAFQIIAREKPDYILSFGGYLALPICIAAACFKVPIFLHEQTAAPGKSNRLLSHLATKIRVALPESLPYFPKKKTKLIGVALRPQLADSQKPPAWFRSKKPCLLVVGGSTGAHAVNQKLSPLLEKLTSSFSIVHQIGDSQYKDFERLEKLKFPNYFPRKYLLPSEMGYFLEHSDLMVARSGANTFFEIIKYQEPAVLIPLSLAANNEQLQHARILESAGVARIVSEKDTSEKLGEQIKNVTEKKVEMKRNFQDLAHYAKLIIDEKQFLSEFGL